MTHNNYIALSAAALAAIVATDSACNWTSSTQNKAPGQPSARAVPQPVKPTLAEVACARKNACTVIEEMPAGRTADGQSLVVTLLAGPPVNPDWSECLSWQFWLAVYRPNAGDSRELVAQQLLYEADGSYRDHELPACPDGGEHGSVDPDERQQIDDCSVSAEVSDNRFEISEGCSPGRLSGASSRQSLRLSPLGWGLSSANRSSSDGDFSSSAKSWDWLTFKGYRDTEFVEGGGLVGGDEEGEEQRSHTALIARAKLPAKWRETGWQRHQMGACAASFDARADRVSADEVSDAGDDSDEYDPQDASLQLVGGRDGSLYAHIRDDEFLATKGAADQLEIWIGGEADLEEYAHARLLDEDATPPFSRWTVFVSDGSMAPSDQTGARLKVEHVGPAAGLVRLRISGLELGDDSRSVALVYRDVDSDESALLVSTGKLGFEVVEPDLAECRVTAGALQPKYHQKFEWRRAAMPF